MAGTMSLRSGGQSAAVEPGAQLAPEVLSHPPSLLSEAALHVHYAAGEYPR